jgi:hypothetical protein
MPGGVNQVDLQDPQSLSVLYTDQSRKEASYPIGKWRSRKKA